jgi:serine/threonine-protein kinase
MLLDEARVAALVKHPNVVDIYDLGQADGRFFIAMEYLEGEPLLAVLRAGREGKRLDAMSTARLIADTAEGLDAAHELRSMSGERLELVHHDISLGNIVVLYNGQVKLVDFGVAKATQTTGSRGKVQGKFSYMAPEKLLGSSGDRRSDIFSLGCVFWEALTLKRLFRGGNDNETMKQVLEATIQPPSRVNGELTRDFDAIVMRSLERDPNKRYSSSKEMAVEIEEVLRVRGYGAKNDRIAKYMQETFKDHIDARKKLVQEVVAGGSASAEVVDAAFSDQGLASGSPIEARASQRDLSSGVPAESSQWADSSKPTMISAPPIHPMFEDERSRADLAMRATTDGLADGERTAVRSPLKAIFLDRTLRRYAIGAGALVVLSISVAIVTAGGDDKAKPFVVESVAVDAAPVVEPEVAPPPPVDAAVIEMDTAEPAREPEPEIEIDTPTSPTPTRTQTQKKQPANSPRPPAPSPSIDVPDTVNKATLAYVKGDSKIALSMLHKARSAKPSYAPTYRVLGKVYKKLGDDGAARKAFQKYVQLAPSASDVEQIKEEIKKL